MTFLLVRCRDSLQATLPAYVSRLVAVLESARSTPGPGEMWREALKLVLVVSVPMRLVHGRLALTFRASSLVEASGASPGQLTCGGGGVSGCAVRYGKSRRAV